MAKHSSKAEEEIYTAKIGSIRVFTSRPYCEKDGLHVSQQDIEKEKEERMRSNKKPFHSVLFRQRCVRSSERGRERTIIAAAFALLSFTDNKSLFSPSGPSLLPPPFGTPSAAV